MSDTLRDQLLGLGFKPAPRPDRPAGGKPGEHRTSQHASGKGGPRAPEGAPRGGRGAAHGGKDAPQSRQGRQAEGSRSARRGGAEMDLAKAYAIRAQKEKDERIAAERERQRVAQERREGKQKLATLLQAASLNDAGAEIARHFEYGGKIRRIYVTTEQLRALNAGELGVVQQAGRYHLVTAAVAREAEGLLAGALALLVEPGVPSADDQYADPKYQVPDDLVW